MPDVIWLLFGLAIMFAAVPIGAQIERVLKKFESAIEKHYSRPG